MQTDAGDGVASSIAARQGVLGNQVYPVQIVVVALCTIINMLDGFDLLAVSFTAVSIAREWQVPPAVLGALFGIGFGGIATGSLVLSPLADKFGRRPAILVGLGLITAGMLAVPLSSAFWQLACLRFITGLGIGTLLSSINTIVAEYSPPRWRGLSISIYSTGYPLGAALSGTISLFMLSHFGWRSVFLCGGAASLLMMPAVAWLLPESLAFLLERQPSRALERAQRVGRRLALTIAELPIPTVRGLSPQRVLLGPSLRGRTILLCLTFFLLWISSFFAQNWNPTILAQEGASPAISTSGGLLLTVGGIIGSLLFGLFTTRMTAERLTPIYLAGGCGAALAFGFMPINSVFLLLAGAFFTGFFLVGAVVGLCAMAVRAFPPEVRATGTGLSFAAGRFGAMAGVACGGILIGWGWSRPAYYSALAMPAVAAAFCALALGRALRRRSE